MPVYNIDITRNMIDECLNFAHEIILGRNQYDRMMPVYAQGNTDLQIRIRIMRTFVGKLGELCFSKFLHDRNIEHSTDGMFDIYEGQANIDEFDFVTLDRRTIDIKTAVFSNHTRLVVPLDQLLNIPKDFYVGIKLTINLDDNLYENLDPYSIDNAVLWGYCTYADLENSSIQHLGEYPCKYISSRQLRNIDELISII
ncbi:MAG: hypothetical protein RBR50_03350 [Candidatus Izemoplasmatales bacterium]|nr:hypothetical protein [Candidatus Izemoplasmatales bacterium]